MKDFRVDKAGSVYTVIGAPGTAFTELKLPAGRLWITNIKGTAIWTAANQMAMITVAPSVLGDISLLTAEVTIWAASIHVATGAQTANWSYLMPMPAPIILKNFTTVNVNVYLSAGTSAQGWMTYYFENA